eukprot:7090398-Prymnesium_polylepis.2
MKASAIVKKYLRARLVRRRLPLLHPDRHDRDQHDERHARRRAAHQQAAARAAVVKAVHALVVDEAGGAHDDAAALVALHGLHLVVRRHHVRPGRRGARARARDGARPRQLDDERLRRRRDLARDPVLLVLLLSGDDDDRPQHVARAGAARGPDRLRLRGRLPGRRHAGEMY